jgi:hypothetical protein
MSSMGERGLALVLATASAACVEAPHAPAAPPRDPEIERWQRASTVLVSCPPPAERDDRPCGLLADAFPPAEASARLADRYPYASIAELRGTCALDASCDLRTREIAWLESHNRHVALRADELQKKYIARRHDDGGAGRTLGFLLFLGVGLAGSAIGASR